MFKVLIVDDEPYIRKGLVNIINWKNYDCEVCGEASDGVEGLEKIEALKPDIVFVDINMPEINGLDMIRQAKGLLPGSKFIILTGYRDFSYLQEAIKLGAYDYILKPSKIEEISEILNRAVFEMKLEREEEKEHEKMKSKYNESIPILKEKLLFDLIHGYKISYEDLNYQMKLYDLSLDEYLVMYVSIDEDLVSGDEIDQKHLYQFGVFNTVMDMFSESYKVEKVVLNAQVVVFIIQNLSGSEIKLDKAAQIAGNVQQLIRRCFNFTVTMSLSDPGFSADELYARAKECENCLNYSFYMGANSIILYRDIKGFYKGFDLEGLEKYEKQLSSAIQLGDDGQVRLVLSQLKDGITAYNLKPDQVKHYYWTLAYNINHIRLSMKSLESSSSKISFDMGSLYKMIEDSSNMIQIHELLESAALSMAEKIKEYNKANINVTLRKAMDYIQNNYHNSITLQELADEVYVSTYYLSRMFTKELGKNFVDYLNEVRMEEAGKLLKSTEDKTYEISEKVGISDAHYFSKLFKKYMGMTPTDYRG